MIVVKKYKDGGKFSLKDLIKAYKDTKPERTNIKHLPTDEEAIDVMRITGLNPKKREELLRTGEIKKIRERRGCASSTGGGGVTIIKGKDYKKKYEGTEDGGISMSYRRGTINPFKRLKAALQSLRANKIKEQNVHSNPRFL